MQEKDGDLGVFVKLADCSPSLTLIVDVVGNIKLVRGNVEAFSGYSAEELMGSNILDHLDLDWDPIAFESIGAAVEGHGLRRPMLFRIRRKDGSQSVVEVTANSQLDDPDIDGLACYIRRWDERWLLDEVLEAIAGAADLEHTLSLLVRVMGAEVLEADGVVLYAPVDGGLTRAVTAPALGPAQSASRAVPGAPWTESIASGEPVRRRVDDLPDALQDEARERGHQWCWAYPVIGSAGPAACLVLWRRADEDIDHTCSMSIARLVRLTELLLHRESTADELQHAATHDALTGLANRARFFGELRRTNEDDPSGSLLGVVYIDLDGFKPVNDAHGHATGDAVLKVVARRLERIVRETDTLARLGGDEFAVICPGVSDASQLHSLAERIVAATGQPISIDGVEVTIGSSVGLAVAPPAAFDSAALIDAADGALYEAKRAGRGGWRMASGDSFRS